MADRAEKLSPTYSHSEEPIHTEPIHIEPIRTENTSPNELHNGDALHKTHTLGDMDLENHMASKGDSSDGHVEWTWKQIVATISLSGIYVGSQIPLYFVGGSLTFIAADLGGASIISWLPVSNTLAIASFAPFCGYLQDIFGRRAITLSGSIAIMIGIILVATSHNFGQAVVGMSVAGAGAAIGELTALAGTAELVPVAARGYYLSLVTLFVFPFTPYVMYCQLLSTRATWRWGLWLCLIYNGIFFIGMALTYFPVSHSRGLGISRKSILKKIDFLGAFLSIVGLTLFLVALQSGGYSHPWSSVHVLAPLLIGTALIAAFVVWEWKFAAYPMVPRELFQGQSIIGTAFIIAFVGGMSFYSLLNFYPLTFSAVYNPDPVQVGLKGLSSGISVTVGATLVNALLSVFKGANRELLLVCCVIMTAFGGALACVTPDNPRTSVALGTIAGFGVGGVLVPSATIAITVSPDALIATTVALSLSIRVIGGSIGYAIYYNIFYNKLVNKLPTYIGEFAVKAGLPVSSTVDFVTAILTDPKSAATIPGVTPDVLAAATYASQWAYADSLKYVWYVSITFGVCSIIACLFLGSTKKYMTNRIATVIH